MFEGVILLTALLILGVILKAIHTEHGPQKKNSH